jgi:hypothetical protein
MTKPPSEPKVHHVSAEQRRALAAEFLRERASVGRAPELIRGALDDAKRELQLLEDKLDRHSRNNPNKYRIDIKHARAAVRRLEVELAQKEAS